MHVRAQNVQRLHHHHMVQIGRKKGLNCRQCWVERLRTSLVPSHHRDLCWVRSEKSSWAGRFGSGRTDVVWGHRAAETRTDGSTKEHLVTRKRSPTRCQRSAELVSGETGELELQKNAQILSTWEWLKPRRVGPFARLSAVHARHSNLPK